MIKLQAGSNLRYNSELTWDHKGRTEISHIYISHDVDVIRFIQFQYVEEDIVVVLSKLSPTPYMNSFASRFNVVSLSLLTLYILYIDLNFDQSFLLLKFYLLTI